MLERTPLHPIARSLDDGNEIDTPYWAEAIGETIISFELASSGSGALKLAETEAPPPDECKIL